MIAPAWQVIGDQKIILDGQNDPKKLRAEDGQDGVPGLSGGEGGAFFGLSKEIQNGEKLEITSKGGRGGRGQDGGEDTSKAYKYYIDPSCHQGDKLCNTVDGRYVVITRSTELEFEML